jgi:hypothetical protein
VLQAVLVLWGRRGGQKLQELDGTPINHSYCIAPRGSSHALLQL